MTTKPPFQPPSVQEICEVLSAHPLIRLREEVKAAYLVGSFAKEIMGTGTTHEDSDVDILLEVQPRAGEEAGEMEDRYRQKLRQHFVTHDIRGKADHIHPQWCGRRVDVYFTYDAAPEMREKVELGGGGARPTPSAPGARRRP